MRLVLIGDGESPHLVKWARALASRVDLWVISSRGFSNGFAGLLAPDRRLALGHSSKVEGGNVGLIRSLPRVVRWLKPIRPDWLAPHYLTSHGTLAWAAVRLGGVQAQIAGSAWGSDILLTPERSWAARALTRGVLGACAITTSDSAYMAERMKTLGAGEVMVFPFGLESLPPWPDAKDDALFFANRALEPLYSPHRVLDVFDSLSDLWPEAHLVMANDGSLKAELQARVAADRRLARTVRFVGRLNSDEQAHWYARARWFISLPQSDSVSVSVLEAMGHGCIPLLSDLPANHELVDDGRNGLILQAGELPERNRLNPWTRDTAQADELGKRQQQWVAKHALFPAGVQRYVARLEQQHADRQALAR
jgi:glycosyltransferase involved in cell wall biosynthesis